MVTWVFLQKSGQTLNYRDAINVLEDVEVKKHNALVSKLLLWV